MQISKINKEEKNPLLALAKEAIKAKLEKRKVKIDETKISDALKQKRGTFVTLEIDGRLRGCIGHILPVQEIYNDVIENALSAAFADPRFSPLTKDELENTNIEISILALPKKLNYQSPAQLIKVLGDEKPGVILKSGLNQATFLPQVWEDITSAKDFLTHLCLKAGLAPDEWTRNVEIETYVVDKIK